MRSLPRARAPLLGRESNLYRAAWAWPPRACAFGPDRRRRWVRYGPTLRACALAREPCHGCFALHGLPRACARLRPMVRGESARVQRPSKRNESRLFRHLRRCLCSPRWCLCQVCFRLPFRSVQKRQCERPLTFCRRLRRRPGPENRPGAGRGQNRAAGPVLGRKRPTILRLRTFGIRSKSTFSSRLISLRFFSGAIRS